MSSRIGSQSDLDDSVDDLSPRGLLNLMKDKSDWSSRAKNLELVAEMFDPKNLLRANDRAALTIILKKTIS